MQKYPNPERFESSKLVSRLFRWQESLKVCQLFLVHCPLNNTQYRVEPSCWQTTTNIALIQYSIIAWMNLRTPSTYNILRYLVYVAAWRNRGHLIQPCSGSSVHSTLISNSVLCSTSPMRKRLMQLLWQWMALTSMDRNL